MNHTSLARYLDHIYMLLRYCCIYDTKHLIFIFISVMSFVHLRVCSDYSLGYGAFRISDIVSRAAAFPAIACTDRYNMSGALEFCSKASKTGVQPICGVVLRVEYKLTAVRSIFGDVLLLAQNSTGYKNLLSLCSDMYLDSSSDDEASVQIGHILNHSDGLIMLLGHHASIVGELYRLNRMDDITQLFLSCREAMGDRLYVELVRAGYADEEQLEDMLLDIAYSHDIPLVCTNDVCFSDPSMHIAHDVMLCIQNSKVLVEKDRPKSYPETYLKSEAQMRELFSDLPEAIENTVWIAKRCSYMVEGKKLLLPSFGDYSEGGSENILLSDKAKMGLDKCIQESDIENTEEYYKRLEYELSVIINMKYSGYFLVVADFISWSKQRSIPVGVGRGSGAGSIVAWALGITGIDPIAFGLLFERFLNPDRVSMPDFDIDFCQQRREEVVNYVIEKYGSDRVAQITTHGKLQARAVIRDVGRVLGMSFMETNKICSMIPHNPAHPIDLTNAIKLDAELRKLSREEDTIKKLLSISLQLEGMYRHVSTHAAGIVIANRPIRELSALYMEKGSRIPSIQYSMKDAENIGLIKFDFLGLKTLTIIENIVSMIHEKYDQTFDIYKVSVKDEKTFSLLSTGKTCGVFQFDKGLAPDFMSKLKPDSIDDLIALTSLNRPGPMENIPSYIARKRGEEEVTYIHEKLEPILQDTYGIIIYQEQVMEIAKQVAGYTLASADLLRRAMGKKIKAEMDSQREIFINGCVENGIPKEIGKQLFDLLEKFASYGFNKSHAAAYSIISYHTAYLKANYPMEFFIAMMNNEIDNKQDLSLFFYDALSFEIEVLPVDINSSSVMFTDLNASINYSLAAINGISVKAATEIVSERDNAGPFLDPMNFVIRCAPFVNKKQFENLVKAGAFKTICEKDNIHQGILLDENNIANMFKYAVHHNEQLASKQLALFGDDDLPEVQFSYDTSIPHLKPEKTQELEFEVLGLYLSEHPTISYLEELRDIQVIEIAELLKKINTIPTSYKIAGAICLKQIRSSRSGKFAFLKLSDHTGVVDVSIFDEVLLLENKDMLELGNIIVVTLECSNSESGLSINAKRIQEISEAIREKSIEIAVRITDDEHINRVKNALNNDGRYIMNIFTECEGITVRFTAKDANKVLRTDAQGVKQLNDIIYAG